MNIELENIYSTWDNSLTHTEGHVFNDISELTEDLQNCTPVRVYSSKNEDRPFTAIPGDAGYKHFYKVRDIENKGYIIHAIFKPELVGKTGIFCDDLEDIEDLIDPVNFVPSELRGRGTTNYSFYNGKFYYKYFIELPVTAFPIGICPLQLGDIIRERRTNIKYMVVGIDEGQDMSHHTLISNSWLSNEDLFNKFYKVTEYGDSVIGVIEQPED